MFKYILSSTYKTKSVLLSSDLVNSVSTLQEQESCSKNDCSKLLTAHRYFTTESLQYLHLWHPFAWHPTMSVFAKFTQLFFLKINKIQTFITQDQGEFFHNQAQKFMQLVLQSHSTCSVNCKLVGLSIISLEIVSLKNQYYTA